MPRATSDRFSRAHIPSAKTKTQKAQKDGHAESSGMTNPIFKTERFGQHILKNPAVAQE